MGSAENNNNNSDEYRRLQEEILQLRKSNEELKKQLAGLEAQLEQAGAKAPPVMKVIRAVLRNRIAELDKK